MDNQNTPATVEPSRFDVALASAGLESEKQLAIRAALAPFWAQAQEWRAKVATVTDPRVARASRLALKGIRCEAKHKHAEIIAGVKATALCINASFGVIEEEIQAMETTLDAIEKAEQRRLEAEKAARKAERDAALRLAGMDPTYLNTGEMPDAGFLALLDQAQTAQRAKIEAEKAAAAKRAAEAEAARVAAAAAEEARRVEAAAQAKADAEERERQRVENERLRKDAEAARLARVEADLIAEQERAKAKAERDAIEAKAKKDRDLAAAKLKIEREAREKLEREAAAAKKAEADAIAAKEREARRLAAAPDAEKLRAYAAAIEALQPPDLSKTRGGPQLDAYVHSARNQLRHAVQVAIAKLES